MVTAATVTTLSKKAQKARRVRKAGEESSLSSTDSESGRPVTRSQGVRKVAVPVNTRKREDKRQAAGQAVVQAESKPVKIKRRASANQQRSTSKNKDVKELGRVIATDEKDCTRSREAEASGEDAAGTQSKDTMGMAATMQRLTRAVAELQASTKEVRGADKEGQHGRARGKYRRRVQRVRRVPSEDGEPDEQSNDEDQHGAELMASTAVSSGTAPSNHVDMTAMTSAIQTLTTVVAKLQPAPSRTQRFQAGRRVLRHSGSRAGEARHNGDSGDSGSSDWSTPNDNDSGVDYSGVNPDGDGSSGDDSSKPSESPSASSDGSAESDEQRGRQESRRRHGRHGRHVRGERRRRQVQRERHEDCERQSSRRSVKDLELPTFTPSPKVSVSTWIDRVDLALKGAAESGRRKWSDHALYLILGNKLMDNAARWWVNMDRRLPSRDRTWAYLKKALLRRYGERLDKSAAEWRVNMRRMMPGETYSDFAAALRDVIGRNKVSERILLAQFYRNLDKTTKKLVKQRPKPATLEEAVDKANEIDDPMDNVAQGMLNIGQPWAIAPSPYLVPVGGTTGQTLVIPGIGGTGLPAELQVANNGGMTAAEGEHGTLALFTNPQGVWNEYSGTWDVPSGRIWNGKFWYESKKASRKRSAENAARNSRKETKKPAKAQKTRVEPPTSSSDESDVKPQRKKQKAAVRQAAVPRQEQRSGSTQPPGKPRVPQNSQACWKCGKNGHWAAQCPTGPKCYACNQYGHMAKECTDAEAKAKNEENLRKRKTDNKVAGNAEPAQ